MEAKAVPECQLQSYRLYGIGLHPIEGEPQAKDDGKTIPKKREDNCGQNNTSLARSVGAQ